MQSMSAFEDLTLFDLEMLFPALFLTLFFEAWSMVGAIFNDTWADVSTDGEELTLPIWVSFRLCSDPFTCEEIFL